VSSVTIGANGNLYFSAGNNPDAPVNGGGNIYALDPGTLAVLWSFPIQLGTSSPIAFDSAGNAYSVAGSFTSGSQLLSLTPNGQRRWAFVAPGRPGLLGAPMVYGNTAFVLGGNGNQVVLYAVNIANGRQIWATPLRGNNTGANPAPALGPSGNVIAASNTTVTAVNRVTGRPAWAFPLPPNAFVDLPPLVDGSGDTYITAGLEDGGGTVIAISATGQQLWENNVGTVTQSIFGTTLSGTPSGTTIGVDGSIYVATQQGQVYAFTDPS
jgi:outer membrane protein assembly factor BamB